MQNVQNLHCFLFSFFQGHQKFFLSKKKIIGQKVLSGLVKYKSVDQKKQS
jgi:hypothetical protein